VPIRLAIVGWDSCPHVAVAVSGPIPATDMSANAIATSCWRAI